MVILLHTQSTKKLSFPCYDASGINREKAAMSGWSKEEVEAELERRTRANADARLASMRPMPVEGADADCIHCGRAFRLALASAGKYGLCDDCHFAD